MSERALVGEMRNQNGGVAKPGSAARAGREGRWFDSSLPDQIMLLLAPASEQQILFHDTATTGIYTLSLHDALPIWYSSVRSPLRRVSGSPIY